MESYKEGSASRQRIEVIDAYHSGAEYTGARQKGQERIARDPRSSADEYCETDNNWLHLAFPTPKAPPNEMRLSCGAELEVSQTELYDAGIQHQAVVSGKGAASFRRVLGHARGTRRTEQQCRIELEKLGE